ncbi:MAG: trypsin-like peptidase domain-containing protein [Ktedonobacteraceae bacterium]
MFYSSSRRTLGSYTRRMHILLTLSMACLFIFSALVNATPTLADGTPGGNVQDPVVRAVDIAQPAVVRILTLISSQLIVHFSTGNVTFPQPGSSAGTSYPLGLSGSGTFISAHGDILTADHVVNPPQDSSLSQFLDDTAAQDVTNYINAHSKTQVAVAQVDQELNTGQIASTPQYGQVISQVFLSSQYTGTLTATTLQSVPADLQAPVDKIEAQSAVNQSDVAIIHVNMNDMPSVQLGDSSSVQQQDQLTIIGFPGNGDISYKPSDFLNDSVNNIEVSSIKTTDTGAQVIQVGGNVEHGDSGGPALDSKGNIVGIVSFGLSTSADPGGTSFLQASNSAEALIKSLNLDTTPGPFQKAWSQAFNDYAATTSGHWHKAAQELQSLASKYPLFLSITPYLTYAQQQAKIEKVPTSHSQNNNSTSSNHLLAYAVTIGAIVVVLLLVVLLLAMVLRRRGKRKATTAPVEPIYGQQYQNTPSAVMTQQGQGTQNAQSVSGFNGSYLPPQYGPVSQPGQSVQPDPINDPMAAFGAAPTIPNSPQMPASSQQAGQSPQYSNTPSSMVSGTLRTWPCGHMNRSNARYCSICGEPAPQAPTIIRRVEQ